MAKILALQKMSLGAAEAISFDSTSSLNGCAFPGEDPFDSTCSISCAGSCQTTGIGM